MKKFLCVIVILLISILLVYWSGNNKVNYDISTPENVVKAYFIALNSKDEKFINSITDSKTSDFYNRKDIKNINLISIEENTKVADAFNKYGGGMDTKYYDVKSYKVIYDLQMKTGKDAFDENGKNQKFVTITKTDENSNWIIREIGEG
ncbi:hypothetical protein psyc5s11_36520 [Clostridium gelidum]|uniref:DUF4829 domain-containing protein n=1 Tax=Clostridium gelidum TaxID=704125 RepID=A0ABN6J2E5_9CLOT|nr:DUF4829 domain-containing protein [Clostridium gelidum]BCZ47585.1 hypothetical protein psyc5s11_36520 [Clostridium gelidum]